VSVPPAELPDLLRPPERHQPAWVRVLGFLGAGVCFLLAVVGWLIPVVTGIPFLVAGLILLSIASSRVHGWINRLERRLPLRWRHVIRRGLDKIPIERIRRGIRQPGERD
jgi:hypothetical protein